MTFEHLEDAEPAGVIELHPARWTSSSRTTSSSPRRSSSTSRASSTRSQEDRRTDRAYAARWNGSRSRAAAAMFRELKAELGVIDFGDQIAQAVAGRRASTRRSAIAYRAAVRRRAARRVPGHERRAGGADAGVFGGGHPVTAVGDPDQNIYAWRGASLFNLLDFPRAVPHGRRFAVGAAPALHELPLGRADPRGGRRRHRSQLPEAQRPGSRQAAASRGSTNGTGEVHVTRNADEWREAEWIAERILDAPRRRSEVVRRRGALPHESAVLVAAAGVRGTRDPRRVPGPRRAASAARDRRGARVRARGRATRSTASRSPGS